MINGVNGDINVELPPIEVSWHLQFDIEQCADGNVQEPWERLEFHELLLTVDQDP
jgi:hypothetical protein